MSNLRFDRDKFFREYRAAFPGTLTQPTVDGLNYVLARIEMDGLGVYGTLEAIAYSLATWKHESGHVTPEGLVAFQPIREILAKAGTKLGRNQARYKPYYGRGLVQVTWQDNYRRIGDLPGIKGLTVQGVKIDGAALVRKPDLMLDPELSYLAAREGMRLGLYRPPNKLSMFFKSGKPPLYVQARDIVNGGRDKADLIASYARAFERILRASQIKDEDL